MKAFNLEEYKQLLKDKAEVKLGISLYDPETEEMANKFDLNDLVEIVEHTIFHDSLVVKSQFQIVYLIPEDTTEVREHDGTLTGYLVFTTPATQEEVIPVEQFTYDKYKRIVNQKYTPLMYILTPDGKELDVEEAAEIFDNNICLKLKENNEESLSEIIIAQPFTDNIPDPRNAGQPLGTLKFRTVEKKMYTLTYGATDFRGCATRFVTNEYDNSDDYLQAHKNKIVKDDLSGRDMDFEFFEPRVVPIDSWTEIKLALQPV